MGFGTSARKSQATMLSAVSPVIVLERGGYEMLAGYEHHHIVGRIEDAAGMDPLAASREAWRRFSMRFLT